MAALAVAAMCGRAWAAQPATEIGDGDLVVLLGSTFVEREQANGWWELALTLAQPERNVRFRNLGWSGDTVWAESRGGFGTPEDGFRDLQKQVESLGPTVVLVGYGANESYAGEEGVAEFTAGLNRLLDMLAAAGARITLLSPPAAETLAPPLPSQAEHNRQLAIYRDAIRATAEQRGLAFADLYAETLRHSRALDAGEARPWTDNGLHYTDEGYRASATALLAALGIDGGQAAAAIGGQAAAADHDRLEAMRNTIVAKNELYFHRWRPQNITYLLGFRQHEQGQNAREIPQFDPLVAEKETEIARLRGAIAGDQGHDTAGDGEQEAAK